ncbi:MAG: hypothetical protein E7421_03330 [Ruminococcaceae bacterium]|nr:hypothetical protein [Oscillospiraceae bacterium]
MKRSFLRLIAAMLSIMLAASMTLPVRAQESEIRILAPLSDSVTVSHLLEAAGPMTGDTADYLESLEDVIAVVRQGLESRQETISVSFVTQTYSENLMRDVLNAAIAHTGVPTQGDYLRWQIGQNEMSMGGYAYGEDYYLTLTYTPEYYTTAQQEAQMDVAVEERLDLLNVYTATDYEKVCAIYDFICENVVYDYAGLAEENNTQIYTAYAALINGTSVCQGYANLFYRLALELGVDARLVSGKGNGGDHGWNIVKLNGKYYNLDATWDATCAQEGLEYTYFLLCEESFEDHVPDAEYLTEAFQNAYPMADKDFSALPEFVRGDIDGDSQVNRNDVISLLLHVTMPNRFPLNAEADFDGNGLVTRDDIIRLLLYVTMPNRFPL